MFDPEQLIKALSACKVAFVIIGGVAARIHGAAQPTQDFDVCYDRGEKNLEALLKALSPFNPKLRGKYLPADLPFVFDAKTLQMGLNFTLTTDAGDIDLLGEVKAIGDYQACRLISEEYELYGIPCLVLNLDALIANKRAVSRQKDIAFLLELEALKEIKRQDKS